MAADVEACEKIFSVNVLGTLLSYKYAAKQMVKQGSGGRIIGIRSCAAVDRRRVDLRIC